MTGCPVCGSTKVAVATVDGIQRATCSACGATWEQRGTKQRSIRPGRLRGARRWSGGLAILP